MSFKKASKDEGNSLIDNLNYDNDEFLFYGVNILDEKEFVTFVKKIEFLCRKSQEYYVWSKKTKQDAKYQNPDPSKDDSSVCPICDIHYEYADPESHHHPITLFNLVLRQFQSWVDDNVLEEKTALDLVQEIMSDHLINRVEHVVICKHCHEKYHNGEIVVRAAIDKIMEYKREVQRNNMPDTVKLKFEQINAQRSKDWQDKINRKASVFVTQEACDIDDVNIKNELMRFVQETEIKI